MLWFSKIGWSGETWLVLHVPSSWRGWQHSSCHCYSCEAQLKVCFAGWLHCTDWLPKCPASGLCAGPGHDLEGNFCLLLLPFASAFCHCLQSLPFAVTFEVSHHLWCNWTGVKVHSGSGVKVHNTCFCTFSEQPIVYSLLHHLLCRCMESPPPCGSTSSMAHYVCSCSSLQSSHPSLQYVTLWWTLSLTMSLPICEVSHLASIGLALLNIKYMWLDSSIMVDCTVIHSSMSALPKC